MALKGSAVIAIWSAIEPAMLAEHDAWHSAEHFPERLSVPGFLRGRRSAAVDPAAAEQRFIFYEIESIAVATSPPYLERLNDPTPWSRKIMAASRLNRTLCRVVASHGFGIGAHLLAFRMAQGGRAAEVAAIAQAPGIVGAHLLQKDSNVVRPSTAEEKLRHGGVDSSADWILLVEAYDAGALDAMSREARSTEPAMRYALAQVATR